VSAIALAAIAGFAGIQVANVLLITGTFSLSPAGANTAADDIRDAIVYSVFAAVGFALASKRPRNAVGWLLLAVGWAGAISLFAARYGLYGVVLHPGSLSGATVAASLSQSAWIGLFLPLGLLLVCFPQGRPRSARWWIAVAVVVWAATAGWIGATTAPGRLPDPFASTDNPLGIRILGGLDGTLSATVWAMVVVFVLAGISLVGRVRRSDGVERQQYKWFAFAAGLLPLVVVITQGLYAIDFAAGEAASWLTAGVAAVLPIATAIAVTRYRLYEIDRIISRTLVYGVLSVVLAATYAGLVLASQSLFSSFAGGSNLAIAVSTLAAAALFLPLRSRVQSLVDRRFYRRNYDIQRTLERFGGTLRQHTELDALAQELTGVVLETMQPGHVTLWLPDRTSS
jgi:hypothetical protein